MVCIIYCSPTIVGSWNVMQPVFPDLIHGTITGTCMYIKLDIYCNTNTLTQSYEPVRLQSSMHT